MWAYRLLADEYDTADGLPWAPDGALQWVPELAVVRLSMVRLYRLWGVLGETEPAGFDPKVYAYDCLYGLSEMRFRVRGILKPGERIDGTADTTVPLLRERWRVLRGVPPTPPPNSPR